MLQFGRKVKVLLYHSASFVPTLNRESAKKADLSRQVMPLLLRLFLVFLKIGATSFGGNVALVAAVRKELCEKRKLITDEELLDYMTLGNILPGPLATNVITTAGYRIAGMAGASICLFAVLLPAFILLCIFSELYLRYGELPAVEKIFHGILPAVSAIILSTAWSLAKKNCRTIFQWILVASAAAAVLLIHGFWATMLIIVIAGALGYFFPQQPAKGNEPSPIVPSKRSYGPALFMGALVFLFLVVFFAHPESTLLKNLRLLGVSFSSLSVTLFGGGYVFIPAIEKVVVGMYQWVSQPEFGAAIAISQVTPGPISISAAFVGWKVAGLAGAAVGTFGIFVPPAFLMVLAQQFVSKIKTKPGVEAVFSGVRPAVIGMIAASVWVISKTAPMNWQTAAIFLLVFVLSVWKNIDSALLVLTGGILGWLLYL
jgi:chromate transporter